MEGSVISIVTQGSVAILSAFLLHLAEKTGKAIGNQAWRKAENIYDIIKKKMSGKTSAEEALEDLKDNPADPDLQASVRVQLKKILNNDENFTKQLALFLKEADGAGVDTFFKTEIHGDVKKLVQIGNVYGDVTI